MFVNDVTGSFDVCSFDRTGGTRPALSSGPARVKSRL